MPIKNQIRNLRLVLEGAGVVESMVRILSPLRKRFLSVAPQMGDF
jgi:hypothetical protein